MFIFKSFPAVTNKFDSNLLKSTELMGFSWASTITNGDYLRVSQKIIFLSYPTETNKCFSSLGHAKSSIDSECALSSNLEDGIVLC